MDDVESGARKGEGVAGSDDDDAEEAGAFAMTALSAKLLAKQMEKAQQQQQRELATQRYEKKNLCN